MNEKDELLKESGVFNLRVELVIDDLFQKFDFFDPKDLVQVKYEMVRRVQQDGWTVSHAAKKFGFSRTAYYKIQNTFNKEGISGFIPKQRGPKSPHKLNTDIMNFLDITISKSKSNDNKLNSIELSAIVKNKFNIKIHPRTIEKALKKKLNFKRR